jgi:hypothetical protein
VLEVTNAPHPTVAPSAAASRLVVVPAEPGPLLDVVGALEEEDVVDAAPGWLDATLVACGLALVAWGSLRLNSTGVIAVGAGLAALGSVVPLRAAWRAVQHTRRTRKNALLPTDGTILDAGDPGIAELVAGYDALLDAADALDRAEAAEATAAGHAAVLETASLLAGGRPETPRQAAYVAKRVRAIGALTDAIAGSHASLDPRREARTDAHEALESIGASSLTELAELTETLRRH